MSERYDLTRSGYAGIVGCERVVGQNINVGEDDVRQTCAVAVFQNSVATVLALSQIELFLAYASVRLVARPHATECLAALGSV